MATAANIQVGGNVEGNIVIGNNNFVVNTNHGTIVYQAAPPQVQLRQFAPVPPRPPRGFINRKDEQIKLESWIAAKEIVFLHAPDGIEKTSLLKQVANSTTALAMPQGVMLLESVDRNGQALGPSDLIQRLFDAIYVTNVYDLAQIHSVTNLSDYSYSAWSPDGQKIAFVSVRDGNVDIYVMNADGSEPRRLTEHTDWDSDPTWSPDSKQIAFASNRDGGDGFQIYVMNADGSNQTRLPNNRPIGTWNSFPNWSHQGSSIVFQSRDNPNSLFQIYVMQADGEDQPTQLTFAGNNEVAEWPPDGKLIAFTTNRDGNNEVYMMNGDGSGQINLTNNPANDSAPAWQPGGGN